ncbi:MAG: phosphoribosylformylglycinamidine synthase, partial [Akkermansiaceae bacterium]|nr:phosphoribosylformylglycinamidine synthase [Akkermansiaceae bacterium]
LGAGEGVYTAAQYFFRGKDLTRGHVTAIASDLLANRLIQRLRVFSPEEWAAEPVDETVPAIRDETEVLVRTYDLSGTDADLVRISRDGILSLSLEEMKAIRDHFRDPRVAGLRKARDLPEAPTDVELECLAQTWSEHCKHKIFAGRVHYVDEQGREEWIDSLFKTYIRAATEAIGERVDWLVSVFVDNAGIIRFNDR